MPVSWNAENEARLMIAIMEVAEIKLSKEQWTTVAEKLGEEFTMEGVRQHVQKALRTKAAGSSPTKAAATPKAKAPKAGGRKKKTKDDDADQTPSSSPRKRGASKNASALTDGDDIEEPESPTKKVKHEDVEAGGQSGSFFDQESAYMG
ncbi:hypothetical protein MPH_07345 [Macrophomina phaseolina MS6]|uniref:Uncharacterized protein n=2 Tax=Macrophomina phaseolina TaxID=35725 RepID=K2RZ52_MACPH|nr:hypothetical protein MPH_07345 [Macrophomina phaseolina MS6]KAH7048383.1 hypothetical protein B0J12DRAFT_786264 [Macrophomina phaseolina]